MKSYLGENYRYLKTMKDINNMTGVQARLPYDLIIR
jgi:hypothetical protein